MLNIASLLLSSCVAARLVLCPEQWKKYCIYLLLLLQVITLTAMQWLQGDGHGTVPVVRSKRSCFLGNKENKETIEEYLLLLFLLLVTTPGKSSYFAQSGVFGRVTKSWFCRGQKLHVHVKKKKKVFQCSPEHWSTTRNAELPLV